MILIRLMLCNRVQAMMMLDAVEQFALRQRTNPLTTYAPWEEGVLVVEQKEWKAGYEGEVVVFVESNVPLELVTDRKTTVLACCVSIAVPDSSICDSAIAWRLAMALNRFARFAFWMDERGPMQSLCAVPELVYPAEVGIRGHAGLMFTPTDVPVVLETLAWL